jgi:VWFA-related protein
MKPLVIALLVLGLSRATAAADEVRSFPTQPGDTLLIQNDYGRITVRGSETSQVEARIRPVLVEKAGSEHVHVAAQKSGDKVFIYSFFGNAPGESVEIEITAPKFVNLSVSGANPEVEITGIEGYVRATTLTGQIAAEELKSSVSLISDRGDIVFRQRNQPAGDARLETTRGHVLCELGSLLNLRAWARAGGRITWDREAQGTTLEKQMGTGGPLLYAASLQGNVTFETRDRAAASANAPTPTSQISRTIAVGEPESDTAPAGKPTETQPRAERAKEGPPELRSTRPPPEPDPTPPPVASSGTVTGAGSAAGTDGNPTFKVNVDWVFLNVSVRDRSTSRTIADLRQDDFQVYEDGVEQSVDHFQPTEVPFNLLLLLDISGSTESYLDLVKEASIDFTRQLKANDRIAVAVFNSRPQMVQNFTSDRGAVETAIRRIRSGGGTAFYDALETSIESYTQDVEGRKAIVVFTDGVDNRLSGNSSQGSRTSFEELYRKVQEIDPIIYPIFLDTEGDSAPMTRGGNVGGGVIGIILGDILRGKTPRSVPRGAGSNRAVYQEAREQLQLIADQTGGRMYAPRAAGDLRNVYSEIADDLRIQYRLGYSSTNKAQDGAWREIRVRLKNHPNAAVRTRRGYYAKPPSSRRNFVATAERQAKAKAFIVYRLSSVI